MRLELACAGFPRTGLREPRAVARDDAATTAKFLVEDVFLNFETYGFATTVKTREGGSRAHRYVVAPPGGQSHVESHTLARPARSLAFTLSELVWGPWSQLCIINSRGIDELARCVRVADTRVRFDARRSSCSPSLCCGACVWCGNMPGRLRSNLLHLFEEEKSSVFHLNVAELFTRPASKRAAPPIVASSLVAPRLFNILRHARPHETPSMGYLERLLEHLPKSLTDDDVEEELAEALSPCFASCVILASTQRAPLRMSTCASVCMRLLPWMCAG